MGSAPGLNMQLECNVIEKRDTSDCGVSNYINQFKRIGSQELFYCQKFSYVHNNIIERSTPRSGNSRLLVSRMGEICRK